MKIGVLGAGAYGAALGKVLEKKGFEIVYYDPYKFPERRLTTVVKPAEILILATPAEAVEKLLGKFTAEWLGKPLIVATKGLLKPGIYEQFSHYEIISGPGFAEEIVKGRKTMLTVACQGAETATSEGGTGETLAEVIFRNTNVIFDRTEDVRGVRLLGALKNVYAIEAGRRGLMPKEREFREFIETTIGEMKDVLLYNGGFVETVEKAAGRGDLMLTCGSRESRNYLFGDFLRATKNGKTGVRGGAKAFLRKTTVEGVFAAKELAREGIFIPREVEILSDVLRRIYGVK
ncbi:hypothetical protein IJI72_00945 [Candidatus Saccharibacteria bacterium]|nr:hypothetical protein [Candidatus Saccharibacteria bacterium]